MAPLECAGEEVGRATGLETNPVFLIFALFPGSKHFSAGGFCWKAFSAKRLFNLGSQQCLLGDLQTTMDCYGYRKTISPTHWSPISDAANREACDLQSGLLTDTDYKAGWDVAPFSMPSAFVPRPGYWKWKLSFPQFVPSIFHHFQHVDFTINDNFIVSSAMLFSSYPLNSQSFTS